MKYLLFLFLVFSCSAFKESDLQVVLGKVYETNSMSEVENIIWKMEDSFGTENVLVVFDIDNTVLAMNHPLGSDQWFSWQEKLLFDRSRNDSAYLVASDFPGLLEAQGDLYYLYPMTYTEKMTPRMIEGMQRHGHKVIALTSRGHDFSYQTIRELMRNGYDFSINSWPVVKKYYRPAPAYNKDSVAKVYGFSQEEVKNFKLDKKARDVQYLDGVFYTAGQHKGAMLKILLKEIGWQPKAIAFVDDKKKHTQRVLDTFRNSNIEVVSFHYTHEDPKVEAFDKSDKTKVHVDWVKSNKLFK
ncbi:MAG: DUF2608 domain-containing protein [Halobacteriovoraceae bacterium]|nr:DUF2608 domain-containing protein [Halobacteriovoraceae bacterium]MCB9095594.1 DUF2608 domain-containing protein [Halobacteriovoraceae bacterium]